MIAVLRERRGRIYYQESVTRVQQRALYHRSSWPNYPHKCPGLSLTKLREIESIVHPLIKQSTGLRIHCRSSAHTVGFELLVNLRHQSLPLEVIVFSSAMEIP